MMLILNFLTVTMILVVVGHQVVRWTLASWLWTTVSYVQPNLNRLCKATAYC